MRQLLNDTNGSARRTDDDDVEDVPRRVPLPGEVLELEPGGRRSRASAAWMATPMSRNVWLVCPFARLGCWHILWCLPEDRVCLCRACPSFASVQCMSLALKDLLKHLYA